MCEKDFGYFCIAHENFESNRQVVVLKVQKDDKLLENHLNKATKFWAENVYPKLLKGAKYGNSL
jgi:hypothetical protein